MISRRGLWEYPFGPLAGPIMEGGGGGAAGGPGYGGHGYAAPVYLIADQG